MLGALSDHFHLEQLSFLLPEHPMERPVVPQQDVPFLEIRHQDLLARFLLTLLAVRLHRNRDSNQHHKSPPRSPSKCLSVPEYHPSCRGHRPRRELDERF
ncbi:hypothetical protein OS493_024509 [Desmophyllum pertusum]|uniref:Uncharacterized protein n=1 Tax=Desmophyllum pertusum TaxID=174260 RepID=A0A9W9YA96_9CNID|nr:hypothetical protein OS493_024509 [Desmophyllum pertusum]